MDYIEMDKFAGRYWHEIATEVVVKLNSIIEMQNSGSYAVAQIESIDPNGIGISSFKIIGYMPDLKSAKEAMLKLNSEFATHIVIKIWK